MNFDGSTYDPVNDRERLSSQLKRVFHLMKDGKARTLEEIQKVAGGEVTAISARLRDLRKAKFGGFIVIRQHRGTRESGLYEYKLIVRKEDKRPEQLSMFA